MKKTIAALLIAGLISGCASIVSDSSYNVNFSATPDVVNFEVINEAGLTIHKGVTPETVNLAAGAGYFNGETYTVRFTKTGYKTATATLESRIDGWYWGNIIFGGVIGLLIVDPASGAMYSLPKSMQTTLEQEEGLNVALFSSLTDEQKTQLVKIN
ncbi:hypothetical protein HR060_10325 [Catenovulum sp. SM1970]|uniref:hypothetical protein n=1 Tax=Marinifaba aquimaris TaxID=2741323 RepID=UPI001573C2E1|nr:hypothetical protein [Marinifaba aquimaris]NTS77259.1 hypothetical protein [Marinifaba aquimaris]